MELNFSEWKIHRKKSNKAETSNSKPFSRYAVILVRGHIVPPGLDRVKLKTDRMQGTRKRCHLHITHLTSPLFSMAVCKQKPRGPVLVRPSFKFTLEKLSNLS